MRISNAHQPCATGRSHWRPAWCSCRGCGIDWTHIPNASAVKFLRTDEGHDLVVISDRVLVPLEQPRLRDVKDESGVRLRVVDEGENLGPVRRDWSYCSDPDLVAVNRFAKLTVSQALSHDILDRLCRLRGMLYRSRNRDYDALPLW